MQPEFHSGAVTRPLSAILQLAMMGCPALRARGELAAGACAPVLGWDRGGSSSAGARAWWGACGTGARGPLRGVFGRLPLARLRESAFWGASAKYFRELTVKSRVRARARRGDENLLAMADGDCMMMTVGEALRSAEGHRLEG